MVNIAPYYISRVLGTLLPEDLKFINDKLNSSFPMMIYELRSGNIVQEKNMGIFNLLNVRYFVVENGFGGLRNFSLKKIYSDENFCVYENTEAYPRAMVIYDFKVEPDIEKALNLIAGNDNFNTRTTALISETVYNEVSKKHTIEPSDDEIKFLEYKYDRVEIRTKLNKAHD
jgi:hypothetical protein